MAAATVAAAAATAVVTAAVQAYRHRDWMALIVPRVIAGMGLFLLIYSFFVYSFVQSFAVEDKSNAEL